MPDVDGDRTLLHIHGKGGKDRDVPLPELRDTGLEPINDLMARG